MGITADILPKIAHEDINYETKGIDNDRVCTDLALSDYGWMSYMFSTKFITKDKGIIKAIWEYNGHTESTAYVRHINGDTEKDYEITVPSNTLLSAFCNFVRTWADKNDPAIDYEYAFNGEKEAIALWNSTLDNGNITRCCEIDRDKDEEITWSIEYEEMRTLEDRFSVTERTDEEQKEDDIEI